MLLLKEIVVVINSIANKTFVVPKASKKYLTAYNTDSGELVINVCTPRKEKGVHIETLAVFKKWDYWLGTKDTGNIHKNPLKTNP